MIIRRRRKATSRRANPARKRKAIRYFNPTGLCAPVRLQKGRRYNAWVGSKVNYRGRDYEIVGCGTGSTSQRPAGKLTEGTYAMSDMMTGRVIYVPKRRVRDEAYHRGVVRAAEASALYSPMFDAIEKKEQAAAARAAKKAVAKAESAAKAAEKALKKAKSANQQSLVLANGRRRKAAKRSVRRNPAKRGKLTGAAKQEFLDRMAAGRRRAARR